MWIETGLMVLGIQANWPASHQLVVQDMLFDSSVCW